MNTLYFWALAKVSSLVQFQKLEGGKGKGLKEKQHQQKQQGAMQNEHVLSLYIFSSTFQCYFRVVHCVSIFFSFPVQ